MYGFIFVPDFTYCWEQIKNSSCEVKTTLYQNVLSLYVSCKVCFYLEDNLIVDV